MTSPGFKTIEIIVSPTGATTVVTHGFTGAACQEASRFLEQALGARLSEQRTSAFYEATPTTAVLERQEGV
ncbi:hypothetical protein ETAA8_00130 [Anatilimnocola aggregata]|uniref:DUF2997 domain-containing protein n=1 Tax=Anatilimnocola aggregata TaxID=2528021 RepID=A0A517Y492_9BACT|nr:DUF2997 domain-containing protein [Anatilimnocola aggregata]QDU24952.1 hypothetical protein ETAA8_00130 [Anatilimnocola aggregata]